MDFWRSEAYSKFFDYLESKGGFYYEVRVRSFSRRHPPSPPPTAFTSHKPHPCPPIKLQRSGAHPLSAHHVPPHTPRLLYTLTYIYSG